MSEIKQITAPSVLDGQNIKYHYDRVNVFTPKDLNVDFSNLNPGDQVKLQPEPDNAHDHKAVAVFHPHGKVGYLYRGRLQDMANDYMCVKRPIYAHIDSIDDDARKITLFLAFYGSTLFADHKTYKLTGGKIKAAQESIELLADGEFLSVSYDPDKEKYEVSNAGDVIGYLPKTAEDLAESMDCYVDSIETDDNDKYVVYVRFENPASEKTSAPTLPPMSAPTPTPIQPPPQPAPAPNPAPPPPKPAPAANFAPPPPKPAPTAKPDPVIQRAERAIAASSSVSPHRPVSPHVQRALDLFRTLYPDSKVTSFHHMRGEGNYFSIHTSQDGQEKRFIVQYDADADAIDCYDTRMNPLSTTRAKKTKSKRSHAFLWVLAVAAVVLAVWYFLR